MKKKDWAAQIAERFVADGRPIGRYSQTTDESRDQKRLTLLLRRIHKQAIRKQTNRSNARIRALRKELRQMTTAAWVNAIAAGGNYGDRNTQS